MVNMPATMIVKNICEGVDLVCCHAGLVTGKTLQEMLAMRDPWLFMWGDQSWTELQDEADLGLPRGMICVYGHFHHRAAPSIRRQRIGIGMEMDVAIYCPEEELIWVSDGDVYHVDPELFYPGGQP
jgi:hypothetical protein